MDYKCNLKSGNGEPRSNNGEVHKTGQGTKIVKRKSEIEVTCLEAPAKKKAKTHPKKPIGKWFLV